MSSLRGVAGSLLFGLIGFLIIVPTAAATPLPAAYPFKYEAQNNTSWFPVSVTIYALFKCRSGANDCGFNDWEKASTSFCLEPKGPSGAQGLKKTGVFVVKERPVKAIWRFAVHKRRGDCGSPTFTNLQRTVDVSFGTVRAEIRDDYTAENRYALQGGEVPTIPAFTLVTW